MARTGLTALLVALLSLTAAGCEGGDGGGAPLTDELSELIGVSFQVCPDDIHAGQLAPVADVTCEQVCQVLGFQGCEYRAGQSGMEACTPTNPDQSGSCEDAFSEGWSSQCRCVPAG